MPVIDIDIELQPKELLLLDAMQNSDSLLIGYGGSRGGAKSHAARSCAVVRRLQYPGTKALIFRKTYDDLYQNHILPMMTEWPDLFDSFWSAEHKTLMLPGGSPVFFRYADTLKDVMQFRGKEYGDVFIDEAADQSEEELQILYTCCRTASKPEGFRPRKVLTFNPGGVGHGYVKRVFIDRELGERELPQNPTFIQAFAWDNVLWVQDALREDGHDLVSFYDWPEQQKIDYLITRSDYGRELNSLPDHLREAWLYGRWDRFVGQMFQNYRSDIHEVEDFPSHVVPAHWRCWLTNDPGFNDPGLWHLEAADQDRNVYVVREWSFKRTSYVDQARAVAADLAVMGPRDKDGNPTKRDYDYAVTGMDAFVAEKGDHDGKSYIDYYEHGGLGKFIRPVHGAGSCANMAATYHEYLKPLDSSDGSKRAKLRICKNCTELRRTLPTLPIDVKHPEQVDPACTYDHAYQSAGYGLQSLHASKSQPPAKAPLAKGTIGHAINWPPREQKESYWAD